MQLVFDLDEFLAYLLPGAMIVILAHSLFGADAARQMLDIQLPEPAFTSTVLSFFSYVGLSLAAGHLASLWSRYIVQPIAHAVAGNPQTEIFAGRELRFYTDEFRQLASDKFKSVFNIPINDPGVRAAAPDMIRIHVLKNNPAAITMRERIIRARSMCGNLTFPLTIVAILLVWRGGWIFAALPVAIAIALAVKQQLLHRREYRIIYTYFIAHQSPNRETSKL